MRRAHCLRLTHGYSQFQGNLPISEWDEIYDCARRRRIMAYARWTRRTRRTAACNRKGDKLADKLGCRVALMVLLAFAGTVSAQTPASSAPSELHELDITHATEDKFVGDFDQMLERRRI